MAFPSKQDFVEIPLPFYDEIIKTLLRCSEKLRNKKKNEELVLKLLGKVICETGHNPDDTILAYKMRTFSQLTRIQDCITENWTFVESPEMDDSSDTSKKESSDDDDSLTYESNF